MDLQMAGSQQGDIICQRLRINARENNVNTMGILALANGKFRILPTNNIKYYHW